MNVNGGAIALGHALGANAFDQAVALRDWRSGQNSAFSRLAELKQPTLVANGVHDVMVGAYDSYVMSQHLPDAELVLYSDAGYGFLFQHAERFADRVNRFLATG